MSANDKRVRPPSPYVCGKDTPFQPGDEQGAYSYEQRIRMNERFVARLERAFANGSEHRQSAAMNGVHASRPC
jgi:hypothetical protein